MASRINKIVLAYSGGLDTSVILKWLVNEYGCEVIAFVADLGQGDDLEQVETKALGTGAGKVCIDLDIDRQQITFSGTPEHVDALIREEVEKLGSREGGLMMIYGLYPGVPLENARALMDAMERYAAYYS